MPHPPKFAPVVLVAVLAVGGGAWYLSQPQARADGKLAASGSIEATTVSLSPEVSGRVVRVEAAEGDAVKQGQILITLDDTLLKAQRTQAEAAVKVAEANVAAAEANADAAAADVERADFATKAAGAAVDTAQAALKGARAALSLAQAGASSGQVSVARAQVNQARVAYEDARDAYDALTTMEQNTPTGRTAKATRDTLKAALATAQAAYNLVVAGSRTQQVTAAQAQVDAALAQGDAAKFQAAAAGAQADAARAKADAATAAVDAAKAQAEAATAAVAVVDAQLLRLAVAAPADGTILSRSVEPGEVVAPGAALMQVADLAHLTLTVYIPEDKYGQVTLGESVTVTVDSAPGQEFSGTVARIADKAEFTPRNVQTVEGRKSTVFAIELALDPADGQLKPGMPADVVFN